MRGLRLLESGPSFKIRLGSWGFSRNILGVSSRKKIITTAMGNVFLTPESNLALKKMNHARS